MLLQLMRCQLLKLREAAPTAAGVCAPIPVQQLLHACMLARQVTRALLREIVIGGIDAARLANEGVVTVSSGEVDQTISAGKPGTM